MFNTLVAAAALLSGVVTASASVPPAVVARLDASARNIHDIRPEIADDIWDRARCLAVIPDLKKAAFFLGGEYGKGVLSCRAGGGWSAPVFLQLAKGSWGFQAGVEQVDLVLLVMNEGGVQKLLQTKTTLGADASVAAGPIGRRAGAATDARLTAEILSYSRSRGLFAGIDVSGGVLRPDEDTNVAVYGRGAEPRTLLASRELSAPPEARSFVDALKASSSSSATDAPNTAAPAAASTQPARRTTMLPTTDDDLRARVVDIEQTLDRILADTTPAPVGTSGTARSEVVTVERARLVQLRQQLDALLAALNRR
jgi:lipid-binding SYLF domain-containing protein